MDENLRQQNSSKRYQRLSSRLYDFCAIKATRDSLWMTDDHLLIAENIYVFEHYKRCFFDDIQAFIIRRSSRGRWWNVLLWGTGALFVLLANWRADIGLDFVVLTGAAAAACFLLGLLNILLGPTCETCIQTTVSVIPVRCLGRIPIAERVLERIRPRIEAAQGTLTADQIQTQTLAAPPIEKERAAPAGTAATHLALSAVMLGAGAVALVGFFYVPNEMMSIIFYLCLAAFLLAVVVAFQASKGGYPSLLNGLAFCGAAATVGSLIFYGIAEILTAQVREVRDPDFFNTTWAKNIIHFTPVCRADSPTLFAAWLLTILSSFGLGTMLFLTARRYRKGLKQISPPSAPRSDGELVLEDPAPPFGFEAAFSAGGDKGAVSSDAPANPLTSAPPPESEKSTEPSPPSDDAARGPGGES